MSCPLTVLLSQLPGLALHSSGAILPDDAIYSPLSDSMLSFTWVFCTTSLSFFTPLPMQLRAHFHNCFLANEPQCPFSLSPLPYPHGQLCCWINSTVLLHTYLEALSGPEKKTVTQPQILALISSHPHSCLPRSLLIQTSPFPGQISPLHQRMLLKPHLPSSLEDTLAPLLAFILSRGPTWYFSSHSCLVSTYSQAAPPLGSGDLRWKNKALTHKVCVLMEGDRH